MSARSSTTVSIVARCPRTAQLGVAAVTAGLGVGKLVPRAEAGAGAVATQALVNPYHGVDGLLSGSDAQMAEQLADLCADPVTRGRMAAHNRATVPALDWANVLHRNEHAYAAAGAVEHACLCVPVA